MSDLLGMMQLILYALYGFFGWEVAINVWLAAFGILIAHSLGLWGMVALVDKTFAFVARLWSDFA